MLTGEGLAGPFWAGRGESGCHDCWMSVMEDLSDWKLKCGKTKNARCREGFGALTSDYGWLGLVWLVTW